MGNKYCTLARVKRWAYHICKLILTPSEIKTGKHVPNQAKTERQEEEQLLVKELLPFNFDEILDDSSKIVATETIVNLKYKEVATPSAHDQECRPIAVVKPFKNVLQNSSRIVSFQPNATMLNATDHHQPLSTFTTFRLEDM
jgi:piRNA pathway germ-plasm component